MRRKNPKKAKTPPKLVTAIVEGVVFVVQEDLIHHFPGVFKVGKVKRGR